MTGVKYLKFGLLGGSAILLASPGLAQTASQDLDAQSAQSESTLGVPETASDRPNTPGVTEGTGDAGGDIIVTGSRIRGVAPVGSSLIAVGREEMITSGLTTTADILKEVPQISAIGFNAEGSTGPASASNITRATAPNLRGIGPTATLTILDGHRVPTAGTQGQLVDPSFLPPLALERIEVIADGASAIYGSDAVAGVVNLVTRKRFTGLEVSARSAIGKNYSDQQIGGIAGAALGSGHLIAAIDFVRNDAVEARDRDFVSNDRSSFGGFAGLDTNCASPGTATVGSGASAVTYALPGGNGRGVTLAQLTPQTRNLCDAAQLNRLIPKTERVSVYGYGDQELGALTLFAQGFYTRREFESVRGQPFLNNVVIPATNPFRPADVPAGTPLTVSYSLVGDVGRGLSNGSAEVYQALAGAEARLGEIRLRVSGSYGAGEDVEYRDTVNNFYLNRALADPNPATALNLFGGPGNNNPATLVSIFQGDPSIFGKSTLKTLEANADGPLFELPGGSVRFAVGGEYREEDLESGSRFASNATGEIAPLQSNNGRSVRALYGELFVPLFGADNGMPGLQRLDLSLAGRYEKYSDFGTTFNPKLGANWEPIDGFVLRGSYGTSFRAPGLSENDPNTGGAGIYTGTNVRLANGRLVNTALLGGGDADLEPETATTWSAGFDINPRMISGLRLGVTYFNIAYENQIVDGFGRQGLYINNPSQYPGLVAFQGDPNFAALRSLLENSGFNPPTPINYADPNLVLIDGRRVNVGAVDADGIDVDLRYEYDTDAAGTFTLQLNGTRFFNFETAETGQAAIERIGTISFPVQFTARGSLGWRMGDFRSQITANYTDGYRNTNSTLVPLVDDYTTVDLDLSYTVRGDGPIESARVGLNVRNLLDAEPPQVDIAGGYDPSQASALGRVVAITVSSTF